MKKANKKNKTQKQRVMRTRTKIKLQNLPRLSVFRSNKTLYAQIIDDSKGKTLASVSSKQIKEPAELKDKTIGIAMAYQAGQELAKRAIEKKVTKVVFDRGGYSFHGKVKALADGAKDGGLKI